jgi:hypothetical protein
VAPAVLVALLVVSLPASGASAQSPKLEAVQPDAPTPRYGDRHLIIHGLSAEPFTVAEWTRAGAAQQVLMFDLAEIPNAPRLEVFMTVVMVACGLMPGPLGTTSVLVNGKAVAEWSFATGDIGKSYRTNLDIDPKLLRLGKNKLEIVGYRCARGKFDVVRFHGIALTK